MYDPRSWNGRPQDPERSGWHWIEDGDGLRPLLWRGDDWLEREDQGEWQDGFGVLSIEDLSRGTYHGPIAMPPGCDPVVHPAEKVGSWGYLQTVWARLRY